MSNKESMKIELGEVQTHLSRDESGRKYIVYKLKNRVDKQVVVYINDIHSEYTKNNRQNSLVTNFNISNDNTLAFEVASEKAKEGFTIVKQWIELANQKRADFEAELTNLNSDAQQ